MHRQLSLASSRLHKTLPVSRSKESNWVRQLSAGEPAAWLHLMEQWSPRLYTYVLYQGISEADAATLLQTIFAEVVQSVVGGFRVTNLTVLLFSVASHHVLLHHHQRPRQRPLSSQLTTQPEVVADAPDEQRRLFLQTLGQLTPEVQQVLLLYHLFDVTLSEIAQIVGQPEELLTKVLYRFKHHQGLTA